jgi:hypothetical protein
VPQFLHLIAANSGELQWAQPWKPGEYQAKLVEMLSNGNKE